MSDFDNFRDEMSTHGLDLHPSELHGQLVGYLCGTGAGSTDAQRAALYSDWLGGEVPAGLRRLLEESVADTNESLGDYSDFEFRLLLPEDNTSLAERVQSLARWCGGFISGFGDAGRFELEKEGQANVREALTDFSRIATMTDDVPEGEENEADLLEIQEFVRVSALLIYAETAAGETPPGTPGAGAH